MRLLLLVDAAGWPSRSLCSDLDVPLSQDGGTAIREANPTPPDSDL